ncbi:hypothetical protein ACOSP7_012415 [Xanthoceras sorbifolium]
MSICSIRKATNAHKLVDLHFYLNHVYEDQNATVFLTLVTQTTFHISTPQGTSKFQRLSGASLLIFANKQDIKGALTPAEIAKVLNLDAKDRTRHWEIDIASRIYMLD